MSKYTIELRDIVNNGRNIFPFAYEFYDENKRAKFERDFIRHFYFREIGCETVDRFILNLEDKMNTVFPVYNAMLKATEIEYNVLDNYYLSETTKRSVKSEGKSSGVSSTVGQLFEENNTETSETLQGTGENTQNETGTSETSHNETSETLKTGSDTLNRSNEITGVKTEISTSETITNENSQNDTTNSETIDGTVTKTSEGLKRDETSMIKKFLDTPQGLTDLDDTRYITTLNSDTGVNIETTESTETSTDKQTKTGSGTADFMKQGTETVENQTSGNDKTTEIGADTRAVTETVSGEASGTTAGETEREFSENTSVNQDTTGSVIYKGEQKTTNDNNTRHKTDNLSTEETEVIHKGNIGVDSDAVMIQKHLKLQQLLAKTFQMFFDECEDLFMMVY